MRRIMAISCGLLVGFAMPALAQNNTSSQARTRAKSHHVGTDSAEREKLAQDKAAGQREETARSDKLKQDQAVGQREETARTDRLKQDKAVGQREEIARADKMKEGKVDRAPKAKKSTSGSAAMGNSTSPK